MAWYAGSGTTMRAPIPSPHGSMDPLAEDVKSLASKCRCGEGGGKSASWEVSLMSESKPDVVPGTEETHPLEVELNLLKARVSETEKQVQALAEVNLALARGLEARPMEEPGQTRPEQAARLAHELLLAAGLVRSEGDTT